ncbi:AbiH family protein [Streptococcus suis]|uniref:AbiH family protein n=1 Tax=Streptococcus suis TaxID=1307 RepID=UPI000CF70316|nr:AbiH family protein [Streptococcus suis]
MTEEVQKYVVVGNGFDLNLGIKSSYNSFLEFMAKEHSLSTPEEYYHFNSLFVKEFDGRKFNWADFETLYEAKVFSINTADFEKFQAVNEMDKLNQDLSNLELEFYNYLQQVYRSWKQSLPTDLQLNPVYENLFNKAHVINFNYTNSLSDLKLVEIATEVYQLHGSLNQANLIFGGGLVGHESSSLLHVEGSLKNDKMVRVKRDSFIFSEFDRLNDSFKDKVDFDLYILGHSLASSDLPFLRKYLLGARRIYLFYFENDFEEKLKILNSQFERDVLERVRLVTFLDILQKEPCELFDRSSTASDGQIADKDLEYFEELFNLTIPKEDIFSKVLISGRNLNEENIRRIHVRSEKEARWLNWVFEKLDFEDEVPSVPICIENVQDRVWFSTLLVNDSFKTVLKHASEVQIINSTLLLDNINDLIQNSSCHRLDIWDSTLKIETKFELDVDKFQQLEKINLKNVKIIPITKEFGLDSLTLFTNLEEEDIRIEIEDCPNVTFERRLNENKQ